MLPFVRQFCGTPSTYLWQDDDGTVHDLQQGEGGEQGDALVPALFALGQYNAFVTLQLRLSPYKRLFAFLDDIYVVQPRPRLADFPGFGALADGVRPEANSLDDAGPGMLQHGWQFKAMLNVDDFFMSTSIWSRPPFSKWSAFWRSLSPVVRPFFTAGSILRCSASCSFAVCGSLFLPLPPSAGVAVLRRPCTNVGVLGRRGFVCREAGGRVSVNVAVRDLDIGVPDSRCPCRRVAAVPWGPDCSCSRHDSRFCLAQGWTPHPR